MASFKNSELKAIFDEIEKTHGQQELAKAEKEASKEESKEESEKSMKKDLPVDPPKEEALPEAPPAEDAAADMPALDGDADAAPQDPAQDEGISPEALQAEYAALSPEELDMHLQALMAAKAACEAAAPEAEAATQEAPPAPEAPSAPELERAEKAEKAPEAKKIADDANGGMKKSEDSKELEDLRTLVKSQEATIKESQEGVELLTKAVNILIGKPMRKAVTEAAPAQPVKQFTRPEVLKMFGDNAAKLTKSERELVLGWTAGTVNSKQIAPIVAKLAQGK